LELEVRCLTARLRTMQPEQSIGLSVSAKEAITRAKGRRDPGIFTGDEALKEVAKPDGVWDWALVGPDPTELRLSGGGVGGVEELRDAMYRQAHSFGLLRLVFTQGSSQKTRFIFIHAIDDIDTGNFNMRERGTAMMALSKMEQVIRTFVPISAKVHFTCQDDANTEFLLSRLRQLLPMDQAMLNLENLRMTSNHEQQDSEEEPIHERPRDSKRRRSFRSGRGVVSSRVKHWEVQQAPRARTATAHPDDPPDVTKEDFESRQRRKVKIYQVGEQVEVFSMKRGVWVLDGEIADVVSEACTKDNFKLRAGSIKVLFDNATMYKWILPGRVAEQIRPSPRVKPKEALVGVLEIEVNLHDTIAWVGVHVEVNKGYLQWWHSQEDARAGSKSVGIAYLFGLELNEGGRELILQTFATRGIFFSFRAKTEEDAQLWRTALRDHSNYCDEVCDFWETKYRAGAMRKQLLNVMLTKNGGV
jgi:hypothetical protein